MKYFTQDFLDFFQELEQNNVKEWFHEHKKRYEHSVKEPFKQFVADLILKLREDQPELNIEPKDAIFRINRDIRFSKDKSPYKNHVSAIVASGGKKDKTTPGLYIQLNHLDTRLYSGAHMLDKQQLQNVRSYIAENLDEFEKVISDKVFKERFGEILGDKNKRLPKEFATLEARQPLIANKSFYFYSKFDPKIVTQDDLLDKIVDFYRSAAPVRAFFTEALKA